VNRQHGGASTVPITGPSDRPAGSHGSRPEESPLLRVDNLHYHYPTGLHALAGVDMELSAGEIVAVVGPSGCGKSTLLSLVAGLTMPSQGQLVWNEATLARSSRRGQKLAMVFQRDTVFPWRTVERNVQFGMECLSLPKDERQAWTDTLLRLGHLEPFRRSYPRALSGGMRRRLGLLMGLAVRPSVLLLDEPFSALDEPTRVELTSDVIQMSYEYGVSVILVTHDLGEAISVADRIVVMSNRPAVVRRIFDVGFGHDRDVYSLRETSEYAALYRELWHELWSAIRGPDGAAPPGQSLLASPSGAISRKES
jgi:NitT/TauT family transport system ATP-binding protein